VAARSKAYVCGRSPAEIAVRIPPGAWMLVCCECCVLSGRGLCDELITRPEEPYRLWCVVVCDLETSRMRRSWPAVGFQRHSKKKKSNLMHKILIYLYIIHLLKSSTCFEHYTAHHQEVYVVTVYMQPLASSLSAGDCPVHRLTLCRPDGLLIKYPQFPDLLNALNVQTHNIFLLTVWHCRLRSWAPDYRNCMQIV